MSKRRILKTAGYVTPSKLPRGPNGLPLCRWCGKAETASNRNTFCSRECVHEHKVRSDPGYARDEVEKRDRGICSHCGLDTIGLRVRIEAIYQRAFLPNKSGQLDFSTISSEHEVVASMLELLGYKPTAHMEPPASFRWVARSLWAMDHITPVVEGGGECGLDNLRTLCCPCHNRETAALARRRAKQRLGKLDPSGVGER